MVVDAGGGEASDAGRGGSADAGLPTAKAIAIASGRQHSCAVVIGGKIRCWGGNFYGQLGIGTTGDNAVANSPVEVTGISGASAISSFSDHTCALVNGGVKCWGGNEAGQLGDTTTTNSGTPVNVVGLTSGVSKVITGVQHTCALTTGGGVKCWGHNSGELGNGDDTYMSSSVPVDVIGLSSGVIALSAGTTGTCALLSSGAVKCWGTNEFDRLGDGTSRPGSNVPVDVISLLNDFSALATGDAHSCAATAAGVSCWGKNEFGQIGTGTASQMVSTPTPASGFTARATAVVAGYDYSCALTSTSGVKCWGDKLGVFPAASTATPTDVAGLGGISSPVTAIAGGTQHVCALLSNGAVKCWGVTDGNALGDGTGNDSATPVNVLTLP